MEGHLEELFAKAQPFGQGELALSEGYTQCAGAAFGVEDQREQRFGPAAARLLDEYIQAHEEVERFKALHYFCQGYLAGRAEEEK